MRHRVAFAVAVDYAVVSLVAESPAF